jgi:hypothetical protein
LEPFRDAWDRLAGDITFRSWTWLSTWWRHYGADDSRQKLFVVTAQSGDGALLAALPCYLTSSVIQGHTLRLLGDGEVCSDHLGLLASSTFPPLTPMTRRRPA